MKTSPARFSPLVIFIFVGLSSITSSCEDDQNPSNISEIINEADSRRAGILSNEESYTNKPDEPSSEDYVTIEPDSDIKIDIEEIPIELVSRGFKAHQSH